MISFLQFAISKCKTQTKRFKKGVKPLKEVYMAPAVYDFT